MGGGAEGAGVAPWMLCQPWRDPCDRSGGTDAERFGGASEGMGGSRASEASEGLSSCARVGVRVFRAGAYGRILYISGFLVVSWYSYYCNRVPHLLMRYLVLEYLDRFLKYRHGTSIYSLL